MPAPTLTSLRLDPKFNGPPDTANGGYACGMVAALVEAPAVAVRLHAPPPLGVDLAVERDEDGAVAVRHGDGVVASARPAAPLDDLEPPVRPTLAEAHEAMRAHAWLGRRHLLSDCVVCSPYRHDGLGLHFGPLPRHPEVNGAVLLTDASLLTDADGRPAPELLWAALDCPSYVPMLTRRERLALLGGLHAELLAPAELGAPLVCVGWHERSDGRKHHTASALIAQDGTLVGRARAIWIELA